MDLSTIIAVAGAFGTIATIVGTYLGYRRGVKTINDVPTALRSIVSTILKERQGGTNN